MTLKDIFQKIDCLSLANNAYTVQLRLSLAVMYMEHHCFEYHWIICESIPDIPSTFYANILEVWLHFFTKNVLFLQFMKEILPLVHIPVTENFTPPLVPNIDLGVIVWRHWYLLKCIIYVPGTLLPCFYRTIINGALHSVSEIFSVWINAEVSL